MRVRSGRMTRRAALAACLTLVPAAVPVLAHPGHSHKVLGTIAKIDGKSVTLKATDGQQVSFIVTARTKLIRDPKMKGVFEELKAGMRAAVTLGDGEDTNTAVELRYSEVATTKK
jgi:hypothetical protein